VNISLFFTCGFRLGFRLKILI